MAIQNNNNRSSSSELPQELLREILLRLPVKSLLQLKCVSKTWLHLISDPDFAKSHFELAAATKRRCLFIQRTRALSYDLDALFHRGCAADKVSLPFKKPCTVYVIESCRGFILLDQYPDLIIWNPSTGAHRRISYYHIVLLSRVNRFQPFRNALFYGFGYDASRDEYLVVLRWRDKNDQDHFDFFSTRTNSWKNFEVALPNPLMDNVRRVGLFLNGAFHWLADPLHRDDPILVFDLKERSFSEMPLPKRPPAYGPRRVRVMELKGCLALHFWSNESFRYEIWVMKEYKVHSSWTLYGRFDRNFTPLGLSIDGDIIGFGFNSTGFSKYNASGLKPEHCGSQLFRSARYSVYTDSLMSLPNDSKTMKKGHQVRQECFEQLDAVTNHNYTEIRERKRIRSAPTWMRDFYCD